MIATLISSAFRLMVPLLLAGLGVLITSKCGIVNMAMEGNMLFGAFVSVYITYKTGLPIAGEIAAIAFGLVYGAVHAFFISVCKSNQTVVGLGMNFVSQGVTTVLLGVVYGTSGISPAVTNFPNVTLPILGKQSWNLFLSLLLCCVIWFFLKRTNYGLRLCACGEDPAAADSVGVNVMKYQLLAMMLSGALGGIAGAEMAVGQTAAFSKLMTADKGFLAYSAVIFGRYSIVGTMITTFLLALLDALQMRLQLLANIPGQFLLMLPYLVTLIAMVFIGNTKKPAAMGKIYERGNF